MDEFIQKLRIMSSDLSDSWQFAKVVNTGKNLPIFA